MGKLAPLPCEECGKDCSDESMNYDELSGLYLCDDCEEGDDDA